jgi:hypothetical protein
MSSAPHISPCPSRRARSDILSYAVFAVALFTRATLAQPKDLRDSAGRKGVKKPGIDPLTCQTEQNQPINHQDGPKHRQIEHVKPTRHKAPKNHPRGTMPELELGQPPDKRPELLILLGGQGAPAGLSVRAAVLQPLILRQRRIEFRLQEGEKEVQQVDAQAVGDDVPPLGEDDAEEEEDEEEGGECPPVGDVGGGGVEVGLVLLGWGTRSLA